MRSAAVFLALSLCLHWTWAQGESGGVTGSDITENREEEVQFDIQGIKATHDQSSSQANIGPDIWTELKELRDVVIKHRIKIEELEQENAATQARLTASESKNAVLEVKMNYNENGVEQLQRENTDLLARVTASENKNTVLEARINSSEKKVEQLQREKIVLEDRVGSSENELEEIKRENAERPKVAFSVGLTDAGRVGPFNTDITLKFSRILLNIGQAYNPTTGVFTAPVRGVYYIRFTLRDNRASNWMAASLYHNDKRIMWNTNHNGDIGDGHVSNALALQLEKGDVIYMTLSSTYSVFDNSYSHTTFGGFLLYAL